jgi:hypothetical protein
MASTCHAAHAALDTSRGDGSRHARKFYELGFLVVQWPGAMGVAARLDRASATAYHSNMSRDVCIPACSVTLKYNTQLAEATRTLADTHRHNRVQTVIRVHDYIYTR